MGEAVWMNTSGEIGDGLREKSKRYGSLSKPFVIAIQSFSHHCSIADVLDALFGREALLLEWKEESSLPAQKPFRHPDGFWGTQTSPQNRHVSAVIISSGINPWNMRVEEPFLLHNPWADKPLSPELWPLRQYMTSQSGVLREVDGTTSVQALLDLTHDWPGDLNFEL